MNDELMRAHGVFVKDLRSQLENWQSDFELLKQHADRALRARKEDFEDKLEKLATEHETDPVELRQVNDQVWQDLDAGVTEAVQVLEDALERAGSRFD
jgi:DNA-binding transcriptional MerR regulator